MRRKGKRQGKGKGGREEEVKRKGMEGKK